MKLTRKQLLWNAVLCLALLSVILWALYAEYDRPWEYYQKKFNDLEYKYTAKQYQTLLLETQETSRKLRDIDRELAILKTRLSAISERDEEIRQLWLKDFGEADRCITCHLGVNNPLFADAQQPFKTHSGDYLKLHPVEKYGCVVCHEGQGPALTVKAAHGDVPNWKKPLLRGVFAQSSCGKCHFMEQSLPLSTELPGAAEFSTGWRLFNKYNCIGCHKLSGYKRPANIAPSLSFAGSKLNRQWLIKWLKNPRDYLPNAKMPRFNLSDEEIGYVADYLLSLQSPPPTNGRQGVGNNPAKGKNLINSLGCLGCHKINGNGNEFAPDLSGIGNKVNPEWLYQFLKKPRSYDPRTIIPDFVIAEEEIPALVAYLMSLKSPTSTFPLSEGGHRGGRAEGELPHENIERGKKLVKDLGCRGCHEIRDLEFQYNAPELDGIGSKRVDELVFNNVDVEKTLINWLKIKVTDPSRFATDKIVTKMPDYDFTEDQAEAIVVFLLSMKDKPLPAKYRIALIDRNEAEIRGKKIIGKYNCLGCHKINNTGGSIGPDLTAEAKKSRPEWLFAFLKSPYKIRPIPILKARMPDFNLSPKDINTIIEYLASVSGESYPYDAEPRKEIFPEDVWNGEKLYQEIFACSACHVVNGRGGIVGPDHTDLASRLKRQWIEQWLTSPQAIKPDVRMPRFKFKDWEFEALTDYLMTLGQYRFVKVKNIE